LPLDKAPRCHNGTIESTVAKTPDSLPEKCSFGRPGAERIVSPNSLTITATVSGTHVDRNWKWQGYRKFIDQLEIQVDRADGRGFMVLTFDTTPGYNDTAAFPATPTQWKYRAIYRVNDMQVGLWSATVSVMVRG
jgi:hypothetical protein